MSLADAMIEHGILEHIGSGTRLEFAPLRPRKWSVRTGRTRKGAQDPETAEVERWFVCEAVQGVSCFRDCQQSNRRD